MLPDSIPASLWAEFQLMRKKIKHPMTPYAEQLILAKLERWRLENGANPVDILNEAIEKSWRGVFLNGHGSVALGPNGMRRSADEESRTKRPASFETSQTSPKCASCGKSLDAGFKYSRKGKLCHGCF